MKNDAAESVLLSREQYIQLFNKVNNTRLLALAAERIEKI